MDLYLDRGRNPMIFIDWYVLPQVGAILEREFVKDLLLDIFRHRCLCEQSKRSKVDLNMERTID